MILVIKSFHNSSGSLFDCAYWVSFCTVIYGVQNKKKVSVCMALFVGIWHHQVIGFVKSFLKWLMVWELKYCFCQVLLQKPLFMTRPCCWQWYPADHLTFPLPYIPNRKCPDYVYINESTAVLCRKLSTIRDMKISKRKTSIILQDVKQ